MAVYQGRITKFEFHPMVEIVDSILHIWVYVRDFDREIFFESQGSIPFLAAKFNFIIVSAHEWDFTGLEGRLCRVAIGDGQTRFLGLIPRD